MTLEKVDKIQERQALIRSQYAISDTVNELVKTHRQQTMDDAISLIQKYRKKAIKRQMFLENMRKGHIGKKKTEKVPQSQAHNHPTKGKRGYVDDKAVAFTQHHDETPES